LQCAERLIQTRGCRAFSYQDIADALKIRKASIHYHFQSKTDLVIAVIDRYAERFDVALSGVSLAESAAKTRLIFGAVQGALLVQRTTGDSSQLKDVISALKS
jgi:TetR/AcrR family transcriptional regulator, transcriptional repressor for nem operon